MGASREGRCPLCGAPLIAPELLDAAEEFADAAIGILAAHCPHCQGYLEVRPAAGKIEVGYLRGAGNFEAVLALPCEGLEVDAATEPGTLSLTAAGRRWRFEN